MTRHWTDQPSMSADDLLALEAASPRQQIGGAVRPEPILGGHGPVQDRWIKAPMSTASGSECVHCTPLAVRTASGRDAKNTSMEAYTRSQSSPKVSANAVLKQFHAVPTALGDTNSREL